MEGPAKKTRRWRKQRATPSLSVELSLPSLLSQGPIVARIIAHIPDNELLNLYGNLRLVNQYMRNVWSTHEAALKGFQVMERVRTELGWTIKTPTGFLDRIGSTKSNRFCMGGCERSFDVVYQEQYMREVNMFFGKRFICMGCFNRRIHAAGGVVAMIRQPQFAHRLMYVDDALTVFSKQFQTMIAVDEKFIFNPRQKRDVEVFLRNKWINKWSTRQKVRENSIFVGNFSGYGTYEVTPLSSYQVTDLAIASYDEFCRAFIAHIKDEYAKSIVEVEEAREIIVIETAKQAQMRDEYDFIEAGAAAAQQQHQPLPQ